MRYLSTTNQAEGCFRACRMEHMFTESSAKPCAWASQLEQVSLQALCLEYFIPRTGREVVDDAPSGLERIPLSDCKRGIT